MAPAYCATHVSADRAALILEPSAFHHQDARGELFWGGPAGTQWWISPRKNTASCSHSGIGWADRSRGSRRRHLSTVCRARAKGWTRRSAAARWLRNQPAPTGLVLAVASERPLGLSERKKPTRALHRRLLLATAS